MNPAVAGRPVRSAARILRIGSVSYLNARPLIHGLDEDSTLDLKLAVPARLLEGIASNQFDVALLPVIDYQSRPDLRIIPSGGIGCDGPILTVRIFSRIPIQKLSTLACDVESHTSVALARIILAETYGISPAFVDLPTGGALEAEAMLLIGDKVVCQEPREMEHQLDLGDAWKSLTGMPFVFAAWIARAGAALQGLPERLELAKRRGLADLGTIVAQHAVPRGWPAELAMQYLSTNLKYDVGPSQLAAIARFHELAFKHGLIGKPRAVELFNEN
jgi:chorismate dehydratase